MRSLNVLLRAVALVALLNSAAWAAPTQESDFNGDGIVSHADYSILGDNFGSAGSANSGDANGDGFVDAADFALYRSQYGNTASTPSILPFTATATPTVGGNVEWLLQFSNVNGALAGHLNIQTSGPAVLAVTPGSMLQDDGSPPVGAPGFRETGGAMNVVEGISFAGDKAYAALGTTLTFFGPPPTSATLDFLTLTTAGQQTTSITVRSGLVAGQRLSEYGYQGQDYFFEESLTFTFVGVPEPAAASMILPLVGCAAIARRRTGRGMAAA